MSTGNFPQRRVFFYFIYCCFSEFLILKLFEFHISIGRLVARTQTNKFLLYLLVLST